MLALAENTIEHKINSSTVQRPSNASSSSSHTTQVTTRDIRPHQRQFSNIYEPRRGPFVVAVSPRPAAAEAAANNLLAAPPARPGSTTGSVATTSLGAGAVATFRTGPVPDDAAFAGAVFLVLAAAGPLSRRLIVFSFSGARGSLVSSSSAVGLALALERGSESRSSPASPDVRFDVRRRVVLLAVPVRSGAGAGALVSLGGGGGLETAVGGRAAGAGTGACKGAGAWTAGGGGGARGGGGSKTVVVANTGLGLGSRARGRRAGKETGAGKGPGADA